MAIKFPNVHIATSVINRILNAADEIERSQPTLPQLPEIAVEPTVPDPGFEGEQLDLQLQQPTPEVAVDEGVVDSVALGGTSLEGIINPQ